MLYLTDREIVMIYWLDILRISTVADLKQEWEY